MTEKLGVNEKEPAFGQKTPTTVQNSPKVGNKAKKP